MNVDDTGRSPYPVVLRENVSGFIGTFYISVVLDVHFPLNTGEVHTVEFSFSVRGVLLILIEQRTE